MRALFCWQCGSNYGHIAQQLALAGKLRESGHEVSFVLPDLALAAEVLGPRGYPYFMAPLPLGGGPPPYPPGNLAEVLLATGFADGTTCSGLARGWSSLFEVARPDVAITDFAPMAAVAALAAGVPVVQVSTGFDIPPPTDPLPSFAALQGANVARLRAADGLVLKRVNALLSAAQRPALAHLHELFCGAPTLLTTIAEIDHYGPRSDGRYVGPIAGNFAGDPVQWPQAGSARVFAYLRPSLPGVEALLDALEHSGAAVICVMPGASESLRRRYESRSFLMPTTAVPLDSILPVADVVCSCGGAGLTAQAMLTGVPVLIAPQVVEQEMVARRVEQWGAGIAARGPRTEESLSRALGLLLERPQYREAARSIAARYSGRSQIEALGLCMSVIETAAATGCRSSESDRARHASRLRRSRA